MKATAGDILAVVTAAGDILVADGAGSLKKLAKGTALQILRTNAGATDLEFATIAAADVNAMPIAGGTFTGQANAQANTAYTTAQLRNVFESTGDASGGGNGDIWLKYTA